MTGIRKGFLEQTVTVPLERILPTRPVRKNVLKSRKYGSILASIRKVEVVEPLVVFPERSRGNPVHYILLDGHLRFEALKQLGVMETLCLVSTDDEGFTYNRQISRLTAVQEHRMILKAIERGVSPKEIAEALDVDVERIRERQTMLNGIAPETAELLKDRPVGRTVFPILRKMKPMRQIEAAEMMIAANRYTVAYARMLLAATPSDQLVKPEKGKALGGVAPEDIARMERQMEKLQQDFKAIEEKRGETLFTLVVAKGYLTRLLGNDTVSTYLERHHAGTISEIKTMMEAIATDARGLEPQ